MGSKKVNNHAVKPAGGKSSQRNTVRIIGGQWRGSKLRFIDTEGLRPSADRARETLFNWLAPYIQGAHCLDLFTGSGALSFEALSRGAASAQVLDKNPRVIACIESEAQRLHATSLTAHCADALQWLQTPTVLRDKAPRHDVVFIDPPFADDLLAPTVSALQNSGLLATNALIYIEQANQQALPDISGWELLKDKRVGAVRLALYQAAAS
jgi:16S rRNA (guanine966-N2)-methyltransferase